MYGNQPFREEENDPSANFGQGNQFFSRVPEGLGGDINALSNLEIE